MNQNYPNLEYVVIDGGSTETAWKSSRKHEDRIAYWCSEKDKGLFDACNKGFARSDGEIMAFVGSDDMLLPGSLHAIGGIFAQFPEIEWLTTFQPAEWDYQGTLAPTAPVRGFAARRSARATTRPVPTPWRFLSRVGFIQSEATFWRCSCSGRRPGADFARSTSATPPSSISAARFCLHAELYATPYMLAGWRCCAGQTANRGNHYATESAQSLAEHCRTSPLKANRIRQAALRWGLQRVPLVRRALCQTIGYRGHGVVRTKPNEADGTWEIQEYRFCRENAYSAIRT